MLEQIIREREQQLDEAIRIRTTLKQQIENYREEIDRFPKRITPINKLVISTPRKSILKSAESQEFKIENNEKEQPSSLRARATLIEEGTLVRFMDFDVYRGLNQNLFLQKIYHWFFCEISDRKNSYKISSRSYIVKQTI
jgi:hypothetical protein